jgi:hypothetical protein
VSVRDLSIGALRCGHPGVAPSHLAMSELTSALAHLTRVRCLTVVNSLSRPSSRPHVHPQQQQQQEDLIHVFLVAWSSQLQALDLTTLSGDSSTIALQQLDWHRLTGLGLLRLHQKDALDCEALAQVRFRPAGSLLHLTSLPWVDADDATRLLSWCSSMWSFRCRRDPDVQLVPPGGTVSECEGVEDRVVDVRVKKTAGEENQKLTVVFCVLLLFSLVLAGFTSLARVTTKDVNSSASTVDSISLGEGAIERCTLGRNEILLAASLAGSSCCILLLLLLRVDECTAASALPRCRRDRLQHTVGGLAGEDRLRSVGGARATSPRLRALHLILDIDARLSFPPDGVFAQLRELSWCIAPLRLGDAPLLTQVRSLVAFHGSRRCSST